METKINLWNIMDKFPQSDINYITHNNGAGDTVMGVEYVHKAMKAACTQTLELASENARIIEVRGSYRNMPTGSNFKSTKVYVPDYEVNKQSILDIINQIK